MRNGYTASRYNPALEIGDCATAEEAIAYAKEGTSGIVTKIIGDRTVAAWAFDKGEWFKVNILSGTGGLIERECPN